MIMKKPIEISKEEAIILLDNSEDIYNRLVRNVFCMNCEGSEGDNTTEIINFNIYLETSGDIVFKGECKNCKSPVARFIETGENPATIGKVKDILRDRKK